MTRLLYIEASPCRDGSRSAEVARAFLDAYVEAHPADRVETLNLWDTPLPAFDGNAAAARYAAAGGLPHTPAQAAAWEPIRETFERFRSADKYLFSVPMWNFGIPYVLKHYVDVLTLPGLAFRYAPDTGFEGLLEGRKAAVVYARAGAYAPGSGAEALDLQRPYMETWLRFIGILEVEAIVVEPTMGDPAVVDRARAAARRAAVDLARRF